MDYRFDFVQRTTRNDSHVIIRSKGNDIMDFIKLLVSCLKNNSIKKLSIEVNGIVYDRNFNIDNNILTADSSTTQDESLAIRLNDLVSYVASKKIVIKINL